MLEEDTCAGVVQYSRHPAVHTFNMIPHSCVCLLQPGHLSDHVTALNTSHSLSLINTIPENKKKENNGSYFMMLLRDNEAPDEQIIPFVRNGKIGLYLDLF